MRETLYIRLNGAPEADVEFGVAGAELRSLKSAFAPLEKLGEFAPGRRVVVFVPADEVRLTRVSVPARQTAKVLQAVPFALEDQVADDIDLLHFAVGARQPEGHHPVAIVSRQHLDEYLSRLRNAGLRPEILTPEVLALPAGDSPEKWSALVDPQHVSVRCGLDSGFSCSVQDLPDYLAMADADKAVHLQLFVSKDHGADWSKLGWPVSLMPTPSALHTLANQYRPEHAINLLQGNYSQRRDLQRHWKPWRLAASLSLALLLLSGVSYSVANIRLGAELKRLDQANVERFQQIFPDQQRIENLEAQLDQKMLALSGNSVAGPFTLMNTLSQALAATPGLKLTGLQYRDKSLYLSMSAKDLQVLDKLRNWFADKPDSALEVQSANAESDGAQIRARLSGS